MPIVFSAMLGMAIYVALASSMEFVAPIEHHPLASKIRGFVFSLVNVGAASLLMVAVQKLWDAMPFAPIINIDVSGWTGTAVAVVLSLIFSDFLNYWNHRFEHRFLWRIHRLHHCQTALNAANSYAHFTERGLRDLLFILPLSLISFRFPVTPFVIIALREMLELYIHSPIDIHFGSLRLIFVDNRFHRIHHSLESAHFDKNFGILFSIWDRIFGTVHNPAPNEWPSTGVAGLEPPRSVFGYVLYPITDNQRATQMWRQPQTMGDAATK
jgi:sterol desaturase/sphingolipid hydroxylase (fatty acid hydroxylase superfamily)